MNIDPQRLQELRTIPYEQYLQTPEWLTRRDQALERAKHRCQLCNTEHSLHVHHRTYERRGNEDPEDLTVLCETHHAQFHGIVPKENQSTISHITDALEQVLKNLDTPELPGITTGFQELDFLTGKLRQGDLILLGGRTNHGTQAIAYYIAYNAAAANNGTVMFSFTTSAEQVSQQLVAMICKIHVQHLRTRRLPEHEWENVVYAMGELSEMPLWISDSINTLESIRRHLQNLVNEEQHIDLVIIDHLGLIQPDDSMKRERRDVQTRLIVRGLKILARELNVAIVVVCHLAETIKTNADRIPTTTLLRESGVPDGDADVVLLPYRDEVYNPDTDRRHLIDIIVPKQRAGMVGEITLYYDENYSLLRDLEVSPEHLEKNKEDDENQ